MHLGRAAVAACTLAMSMIACGGDRPVVPVEPLPKLTCAGPDLAAPAAVGAALFALADANAVTDSVTSNRLAAQKALPWVACVQVARLVAGADTLFAVGRVVSAEVEPGRRLEYLIDQAGRDADGSLSWHGKLQGGRYGEAGGVLTALGLTATLRAYPPDASAIYSIQPIGGGFHAITLVDDSRLPRID